jgi:uncharacterized membrane-anchored protein
MRGPIFAVMIATIALAAQAVAQSPEPQAAQTAAPQAADAAPDQPAASEAQRAQLLAQAKAFYDGLDRRTGAISIAAGKVTLSVPETHYFVGAQDSRRIIVDVWGNPPDAAEGVEGMIFPRDGNPMLDSWGAVVSYRPEGHVSDSDAATIDYAKLLGDMQSGTEQANAERRRQGYPAVTLVGWAEQPHYDAATRKLYWAKHLRFEGAPTETLNYDIRVLGREGFLELSFIADLAALDAIRQSAPAVLSMPEFTTGNRYADFREGDRRAAYGIGGLIAGGAAVAVAQKTGILAAILAFGKKFVVLIIAGGVALFGAIGRMLGFGKKQGQDPDPPGAG